MELNFDKEIDALLRQAAKSESFAVDANGSNTLAHIDADALSAFAENALPEKTRALYMTHLGDCDRCRKILSNLISLNSEPWPPATSNIEIPEIAAAPIPWYSRLFIFPNLAYTMGALVLVFSGLLGFVVVRNLGDGQTNVAGVANKQPVQSEAIAPAAVPMNANSSMPVTNANSAANSAVSGDPLAPGFKGVDTNSMDTGERDLRENGFVLDGVDKSGPPPSAGATPEFEDRTRDDGILTRKEPVTSELQKKNEDPINLANPAPPPPPPAPEPKQAERAARADDQPAGGLSAKDLKTKTQAPAKMDRAESNSGRKRIAGRDFNRRDGVWYDSAYSTQPVTSVRRNTDEYRKLDPGVRSIADSLSGTVVVVWKERAYRIQ